MDNFFDLVYNDIFKMKADALVFSDTLPAFEAKGALCKEIYRREGMDRKELQKRRRELLSAEQDGLVLYVTESMKLGYKWLLHITVPDYYENIMGENEQLANCYKLAVMAANELGAESIVFPLLGAGSSEYSFDPVEAYDIARGFINKHILDLGVVGISIAVNDRALYDKLRRFEDFCDDFILLRQGEREILSRDVLGYYPFDISELNEIDKRRLYKEFERAEQKREQGYKKICRDIKDKRKEYLRQNPQMTDRDFSRHMIAETINEWLRAPKEDYSGGHYERRDRSLSELAEMICAAPSTITTLSAGKGKFPSRELLIAHSIAMKLSYEERVRFILYRNEDEIYPHGSKEEIIEGILSEYEIIPEYDAVNRRLYELTGMMVRKQRGEKPDRERDI